MPSGAVRKRRPSLEPLETRQLLASGGITGGIERALKKVPKAAIAAAVAAGPDGGGSVTIAGKSSAKAKVTLDLGADGSIEQTVKADARGRFQFKLSVGFGATSVRLSTKAAGKKPASTALVVNRADLQPPSLVVQGLTPGALVRSNVSFTGTARDTGTGVAMLTATVDDGTPVAVPFDASGNFSFTPAPAPDGTHKVRFVAVDRAGNSASTDSGVFTLDTRPPIVQLSAPADGALQAGDVVVTGQVTDALSGPAALSVDVDGGPSRPVTLSGDGGFTFSAMLPLDGSADGPHQVHLVAGDRAGNVSSATTRSFILETRGPDIALQGLTPGLVTAGNISVTGHVSDVFSGITALQAQVDVGTSVNVPVDPSGNFSFTTALKLDGSDDGAHHVEFSASNGAGKSSATGASFTLETTGPTLTIASPTANLVTATNVTVRGRVQDALSGISAFQAQVDAGTAFTVPVDASGDFAFSTTLDLDGSDDGVHIVRLTATNGVGKSSNESVSFTLLSSITPSMLTLTVSVPAEGSTEESPVRLIGQVSESGPATPTAQYALDGAAFTPLPLDSLGRFDQALSATPLALGPHQVTVKASDTASNTAQRIIHFTVAPTP